MTATQTTVIPDGAVFGGETTRPRSLILFDTGPSLERIPDDILDEILSYLPTLNDRQVLFGHRVIPPVIPSSQLIRTPTLRSLSQTSQLLRLRCLAVAWQSIELCGASVPQHNVTFPKAIGRAIRTAVRVLKVCPHLMPLVRKVSVVLTHYHSKEIIPAFAACLAKLPNLTTLQVIHVDLQMSIIEDGFEGKNFPSVQTIFLPGSAHGIIKCCPNVEEVICTEGNGSTVVGSLVNGRCQQVRILKGIDAPLTRLVRLLPRLKYIDVPMGGGLTSLTSFPLLETIEILARFSLENDQLPTETAAPDIKEASIILRENKSQAKKTVILTSWHNVWDCRPFDFDPNEAHMTREVISV